MDSKNRKRIIYQFIESFFITFAIMNIGNISTADILSICIFGMCMLFLNKNSTNISIAGKLPIVTASIFTILMIAGGYRTYSDGLSNKAFIAIYLAATAAGLFFLFWQLVSCLVALQNTHQIFEEPGKFSVKYFWVFSVIIFLCMLPFFLMNYPAVMTPDSLSQYRQIIHTEGYSNHHPWIHTMLFKLFYEIGYGISGNIYIGISVYTIVQMALMAFGMSYSITSMREMGLKKPYCIALLLIYVLYPFHMVYSVTIWKDILFSMAVLVLTITLFRMYQSVQTENSRLTSRDCILFSISSLGMCVLRHNGLYAFVAAFVVLLILWRRKWKPFLLMGGLVLAITFIIKGPVMDAANVVPGEFAYSVCIPLQQIARVITDGGELTQEEETMLSSINDLSYIPQNYQPEGADPMFAWVLYGNQDYLISHKGEFLKLWIGIGLRYPGEYVQAFLDQTRGYWYPMDPQQVMNLGITDNEDGLISQPIIKGKAAVKCNELLTKLYTMIPLYGILYSMGFACFLLLFCLTFCIRNRDIKRGVCYLPVFALQLTLLIAVPLAADMRYGYPMVLAIPFITAMAWKKDHHLER